MSVLASKGRERRRAILSYRTMGFTILEIAGLLDVSPKTVEYHWALIQAAFGERDPVAIGFKAGKLHQNEWPV